MCDHESNNIPTSRELDNNTGLYYLHNCDRCIAKGAMKLEDAIKEWYHLRKQRCTDTINREEHTLRWHTREEDLRKGRNKIKAARRQLETLQEKEEAEIRAAWKHFKRLWPGLDGLRVVQNSWWARNSGKLF